MRISRKMKLVLPAIALALTTSYCEPPPMQLRPPLQSVLILAEASEMVENIYYYGHHHGNSFHGNSLNQYLGYNNSEIHALVLGFLITSHHDYPDKEKSIWQTYGLGALTNKGDRPVYVLTGTLEKPYAVAKMLSKMYPNDKIWSNPWEYYGSLPTEIMPPPSVAQVREIVEKYRSTYKPASVGSTADFPGLTTIKPGETKPVVHASIAPVEWKESEKGAFPGADILRERSNR